MKKLLIACTLILVGAIVGCLVTHCIESQNKRNLYKSFYIHLVTEKFDCLSLKSLEDLKNSHEQQFVGLLRSVRTLTNPNNKGKIDWDNYNSLEEREDFGLKILLRTTRDISEVDFISDEIKQESIDLLEQIKSNNP